MEKIVASRTEAITSTLINHIQTQPGFRYGKKVNEKIFNNEGLILQ